MLSVSVIAPVYRNESTLASLVHRIRQVTEGEIVLVNDASPDGSGRVMDDLARKYARVRAIHLAENGGQSRAVLRGMRESTGQRIVVMDADLQDPPEAIPLLLQEMDRNGWDAVFAGRRGVYQGYARMVTSKLFKLAIHLMCHTPVDAGGFYAITRAVATDLATLRVRYPYLPAMIGYTTKHLRSIPVKREVRPEGRSAYSPFSRTGVAWKGLRTAFELKAMRF